MTQRLTTSIFQCRGVERAEPDRVHPELVKIRDFAGDTLEVTDTISVRVGKRAGVDLVDTGLAPPVFVYVGQLGIAKSINWLLTGYAVGVPVAGSICLCHDSYRCKSWSRRRGVQCPGVLFYA